MNERNAVVGVFLTHLEAEGSIKELQLAGFNMKKLSIVGKDFHTEEHVIGYYNAGDRMKVWGKLGAFWGGFWGLLFGSALFVVPGLGSLVVFGPLVGWMVGALEGALTAGGWAWWPRRSTASASPRTAASNTRPPSVPTASW
ncbi:MAG: general stress protein [Geothrix sp.]|uniref:general stress protein n=1 Tax=Geothrix sp. TaxID=1962974 RepID=UPI003BAEE98F